MLLHYFISVIFLFVKPIVGLYPSSSEVVELTAANFDRLVIQSDAVWVVEFFAPWCGHCQALVPEYSKAATALKGVIKVGAVNADEHKSLGARYGVQGFPTIKIFGVDKNKPEDYNNERTAKAIVEAALSAARRKVNAQLTGKSGSGKSESKKTDSKDVIELTDSNFDRLVLESDDMWLVEFYAPWCGHCKNLAPHWAQAATELKGKVKLGALDATTHTTKAAEYNVRGYPTIKYFPKGRKDRDSAQDYDGGRTSNDIVRWAMDKVVESLPPPEVVELVDEDALKKACGDMTLCVVSVLPHILDCQSECRNNYLDILREMADKYKSKYWGWVWAEAQAQPELENVLEIGGFGYPAMAVVNFKKMKYSLFRGSFSKDGINEFLRDLSFGRGQTAPVKGASIPKIITVQPWDGKDGQLPVDDDIDLSDVVLDEKEEL